MSSLFEKTVDSWRQKFWGIAGKGPQRPFEEEMTEILGYFDKRRKETLALELRSSLKGHHLALVSLVMSEAQKEKRLEEWPLSVLDDALPIKEQAIDFVACCIRALGRPLTDKERMQLCVLSEASTIFGDDPFDNLGS
jgi:hypothetical protein